MRKFRFLGARRLREWGGRRAAIFDSRVMFDSVANFDDYVKDG
jgi:hypothetical protein